SAPTVEMPTVPLYGVPSGCVPETRYVETGVPCARATPPRFPARSTPSTLALATSETPCTSHVRIVLPMSAHLAFPPSTSDRARHGNPAASPPVDARGAAGWYVIHRDPNEAGGAAPEGWR